MASAGTDRARSRTRIATGLAGALLAAFVSSGCLTVTIYQPQRAIHRPVVVTRAPSNFQGLRVLVRCYAHDQHMPPQDASKLCSRVSDDLGNQGAESEWVAPVGAQWVQPEVFGGERPHLTVEIISKIDHEYSYPLTLLASVVTLTVVPSVSEYTYSQQVRVLGRDGSVLTEELFRERFVEYHGIAIYSVNWLLDWFVREEQDELMDDAHKKDFSADFLGQIRQLAFNARIRSEILGLTAPPGKRALLSDGLEGEGTAAADGEGQDGEGGVQDGAAASPDDVPPAASSPLPGLGDDPAGDDPAGDEAGP